MTEPEQCHHIFKKVADLKYSHSNSEIELSAKIITLPQNIGEHVSDWLTDNFIKAESIKL